MSIALEPLSHKVQRTAVGTMVDVALAHVRKDRQKAFAEMVDVANCLLYTSPSPRDRG